MSETAQHSGDTELLPTVTLQHRYGEHRILANREDYVRGKDARFRNWLLANDDPELRPAPCTTLAVTGAVTGTGAPDAPAPPPPPVQTPTRPTRRRKRGRRK